MWFLGVKHKQASTHRVRRGILAAMNDAPLPGARRRDIGAVGLVRPYAETLAMVAASTLVGMLIAPRWGNSAVDLFYLPAVLAAAGFYGLAPGLLAAAASALAFNYYFTEPFHTFHVNSPEDIATIVFLFLVALVTSQLAARMRAEARSAEASASRNATIAGLARRLLSTSSAEQIGQVACRELGRLFDSSAVLMAGQPEPKLVAAKPSHMVLTPADIASAAWAMEAGRPVGRGADAAATTEWVFYPVRSDSAVIAVIGLARDDGTRPVPIGELDLLDNLVDQVALALERSRLDSEAREFAAVRERDRTRSALLSTIGQDISPHLSAITAAVAGLMRGGEGDRGLLSTLGSESGKLQRYLANLLDLGPESDDRPLEVGEVTIDLFRRVVRRHGEEVHLTPKEYGVLAELAKHPGRVLTHAHLLRTVWGPAQEKQSEYLRVAVRALRQKLEPDPAQPAIIINEPAVGYRLATPLLD
jgi:two-component system sensor histidine kinase KdpD